MFLQKFLRNKKNRKKQEEKESYVQKIYFVSGCCELLDKVPGEDECMRCGLCGREFNGFGNLVREAKGGNLHVCTTICRIEKC